MDIGEPVAGIPTRSGYRLVIFIGDIAVGEIAFRRGHGWFMKKVWKAGGESKRQRGFGAKWVRE